MMADTKKNNATRANDGAGTNTAEVAAKATAEDLAALEARIKEVEQEREKYLDLAQRARADFENYQKRIARDLAIERRFAQAPLAADLLGPIDNLERATAAAQQVGETGPLVQGVALVQNQLLDILRRHGITRIEAEGKPFDANVHEAVMQQSSPDVPPFTVLKVLEPGYMIHDRVLRPARVIVSTAPPADENTE
jgi:molecular chaperone GrpE